MDLIANYGSSSEEEDDREQPKSPVKPRGSLFASLPAPKQRAVPAFPSPPPPKIPSVPQKRPREEEEEEEEDTHKSASENGTEKPRKSLFDSLPAPKTQTVTSAFSLPPPKNKSAGSAGAKRVVEFKPPVNRSLLEVQDDDDEPVAKKRAISDGKAVAAGLTALLPPPKNSLGLGSGSAGGHIGRRSVIEASNQSTDIADEPSAAVSVDQSVFSNHEGTAQRIGEADYGLYPSSDRAAWSHGNYYEENHCQYPQNWSDEASPHGWKGETAQTVEQPSEGAGSNAAKFEKKRGRNEIPSNIIEVKQDELMSNRPRQDQARLTGIAFGPSYQPVSSVKDKPSKLHKRKHQIGSLYFDLKQREMELAERRARGQLTKAETQAKYGW